MVVVDHLESSLHRSFLILTVADARISESLAKPGDGPLDQEVSTFGPARFGTRAVPYAPDLEALSATWVSMEAQQHQAAVSIDDEPAQIDQAPPTPLEDDVGELDDAGSDGMDLVNRPFPRALRSTKVAEPLVTGLRSFFHVRTSTLLG